MTKLVWDEVGERSYQSGVSHGVLYLNPQPEGAWAVWNGLKSVEESSDMELKQFYLDGIKYLETLTPGDFSGKLTAYTYPEEFDSVSGIAEFNPGFAYYDQPPKSFNLSYRTKIGDDLDPDRGYKIHILYNVLANPDTHTFATLQDKADPMEFSWSLTGTPPKPDLQGYRPTVHISIDSTTTPPDILAILEAQLYGTDTSAPSLPSIDDVAQYFGYLGSLVIVDHGDGTWSAIDGADTYITMLDPTSFKIDNADTVIIDSDTYTISTTNP
jgi:hypothetical protein